MLKIACTLAIVAVHTAENEPNIKNLRQDMNKGKGAVSVLIFLAGIVAAIVGVFKCVRSGRDL